MQKTILSLVQTITSELTLSPTNTVLSSQDETILKLLSLVRATCDDLLAERTWQVLQARYSFTTSAGIDNYALPADAQELVAGTFTDGQNQWLMCGPLTPVQWSQLLTTGSAASPFSRFRVYADRFYVLPVPDATPHTFTYEYISRNYVRDGATQLPKPDFTQDSDICVFDHRVVIYGTKLKWLASTGEDTTAALVDYTRALEFAKGRDIAVPTLSLLGGSNYRSPIANLPEGNWGL